MTKEELEEKVKEQKIIIRNAKRQIYSYVAEYIEGLPYKVDDKISCSRCDICWIASIKPNGCTGFVEIRVNTAKKDGTRSNREFVLCGYEIDSIKKID